MNFQSVKKPLKGEITIPGDKSISHRAVMFGSLADGTTEITHFLQGADCLSTIDCFRKLGVQIENTPEKIIVHGKGITGLQEPVEDLYTGNSGTTTRIISGILAGQTFPTVLNGDASIQKRPMGRIINPLTQMGAKIESLAGNGCTPLKISPSKLKGITYTSPVASAQVKSAVLMAGLYADSPTTVIEPAVSRNHTELMIQSFGAKVESHNNQATIYPYPKLVGQKICVPGDISSAAYFIAAGLLVPGSEILIKNVGINPTRDGILRVAKAMGGNILECNKTISGEPTCDLLVKASSLRGTIVEGDLIPTLIDEIPIIAIMAACAEGTTIIRDAAELKVKESDRIAVMTENLTAMGCDIEATDDGMIIHGGRPLNGARVLSHLDHRIAMSFAVASLVAEGETIIQDAECVNISYPAFYNDLASLQ